VMTTSLLALLQACLVAAAPTTSVAELGASQPPHPASPALTMPARGSLKEQLVEKDESVIERMHQAFQNEYKHEGGFPHLVIKRDKAIEPAMVTKTFHMWTAEDKKHPFRDYPVESQKITIPRNRDHGNDARSAILNAEKPTAQQKAASGQLNNKVPLATTVNIQREKRTVDAVAAGAGQQQQQQQLPQLQRAKGNFIQREMKELATLKQHNHKEMAKFANGGGMPMGPAADGTVQQPGGR